MPDLYPRSTDREDKLNDLLNGEYAELRDQNFVNEDSILVYDEATEKISEVRILDLALKYPCGSGNRWSHEDLGRVIANKALGYRQSMIAHEITDEDAKATPACMTSLLWITTSYRPYRRLTITARIIPGQ